MFSNSFMNSPKSRVGTRYIVNTHYVWQFGFQLYAQHPISCSFVMHYNYRIKILILFDKDAHFSFCQDFWRCGF
jgi:hypothetical protein